MASSFERVAQYGLPARELALDGVDGDSANRGELAVRQAVHVVEGEQHARFAGDDGQRARYVDAIADRAGGRRRAHASFLEITRWAASSQLVHADVREDPVEPRGHRPAGR